MKTAQPSDSAVATLCGFTLVTLVSLVVAGTPAQAQSGTPARARAALQCQSYGMGPMLDCTVQLTRADGRALDGAQVSLGALMPSMPMAHTIQPVKAKPTGKPGEYRGTLTLEMLGVWAVEVDIAGPARDRVSRSLMVHECPGDQRCAATEAKASDKPAGPGGHRH